MLFLAKIRLSTLWLLVVAVCLALPAGAAAAQETTGSTPAVETAPAPAQPAERPFVEAVLTGNNVNVRQGPGTEFPIYYTAPMGTRIKVVGRKGQWLEIEFPAKSFSWVSRDYLQKTAQEDIGIVTGSNVSVRSGPGTQFDRNYVVQAGHKFKILGIDASGVWYRVSPMPGATAWIIADYVKLSGPLPGQGPALSQPAQPVTPATPATITPATPTAPASPQPAAVAPRAADVYAEKMKDAEKAFKAETSKENPVEWDLDKLEEAYKDVEANASQPLLVVRARARLAELKAYAAVKEHALELGKVDDDLKARLAKLEKARQQETAAPAARATSPYIATGKIEKLYIPGIDDTTHKLMKDDESISYLLRSKVLDLAVYDGKVCGLKGTISSLPGIEIPIIDVTSAAVLAGQGK